MRGRNRLAIASAIWPSPTITSTVRIRAAWSELERRVRRPADAFQVQRPPQLPRAIPPGRARLREPLLEHQHRLRRVDEDVAIPVTRLGLRHDDLLVPAVHAAHGIWLHAERHVLVHAAARPPDLLALLVRARERAGRLDAPHQIRGVRYLAQVDVVQLPVVAGHLVAFHGPAPHVVAARDEAGPHTLGDPDRVHVVADARAD